MLKTKAFRRFLWFKTSSVYFLCGWRGASSLGGCRLSNMLSGNNHATFVSISDFRRKICFFGRLGENLLSVCSSKIYRGNVGWPFQTNILCHLRKEASALQKQCFPRLFYGKIISAIWEKKRLSVLMSSSFFGWLRVKWASRQCCSGLFKQNFCL